jgi:phosphoenolpyruvate carboxylase
MYNYPLPESLIHNIADKYNFRVQVVNMAIIVYSKWDEWVVKPYNEEYFMLYHKNKRSAVNREHKQSKFKNNSKLFEEVFNSIKSHDKYMDDIKFQSRVINLMKKQEECIDKINNA